MRSQPTAAATGLASILPDQPASSLALAAAVAASARDEVLPVEPDALLLALGADMDRQEAALVDMRNAMTPDIEGRDPAAYKAYVAANNAQADLIERHIASLRATSPAGIVVKARAIACLYHPDSFLRDQLEGTPAEALLRSLVNDFASASLMFPHPHAAPLDLNWQWPALAARWAGLVRQRAEPDESEDRALARVAAMDEVLDAAVALPARAEADRAIKARMLAQASGEIAEDDQLLSGDDACIAVWARRKIEDGCPAERLTASLCLDLLHIAPEPTEVAHPDAALIDLGWRWMAIQHEWEDTGNETDVEMKERNGREGALVSAIVACPATTFAGLSIKARILARESDCEAPAIFADTEIAAWAKGQLQEQVWQDRVVGSLCLDLLRLAQETGR